MTDCHGKQMTYAEVAAEMDRNHVTARRAAIRTTMLARMKPRPNHSQAWLLIEQMKRQKAGI
jgi:hypothetical protein